MGDQDLDVGDVQHRIDEGKALLCNVESLKSGGIPLPGCIKLANRIKSEIKYGVLSFNLNIGSDYFTENFQLRENKTRMRNIHPRFFHLLF